jgi:holo-[acyl-carrier protein] synthase
MSLGIGIDILSIENIRKAVERRGEYFLRRAFTSREIQECFSSNNPYPCLAGKFAAKEAVYKALQSIFNLRLFWREIEIVTEVARPSVKLNGRTAEDSARNGVGKISVSITHDLKSGTAVAVALAEYSRS